MLKHVQRATRTRCLIHISEKMEISEISLVYETARLSCIFQGSCGTGKPWKNQGTNSSTGKPWKILKKSGYLFQYQLFWNLDLESWSRGIETQLVEQKGPQKHPFHSQFDKISYTLPLLSLIFSHQLP